MHHHKAFNSFLDKYLEASFLLPTSHLNSLPVCLRNSSSQSFLLTVISSIAPLLVSQSHVICSHLSIFMYRTKQILLRSCTPLPLLFTAVCLLHCQAPQNYHLRPLSRFYTTHYALDHCSRLK